jgi:hypothetical protein
MVPVCVTVHDTGNPNRGADAAAHANYLKGDVAAQAPVSWHFTVDDGGGYQHLPLNEHGWHAGDGHGPGNMTSVGVEICEHADGDRPKAEDNAAAVIAWLLFVLGLSPGQVVPHQYWYPARACPHLLLPRWTWFIDLIREKVVSLTPPPAKGTPILGPPQVTVDQAQAWARSRGATEQFVGLASLYWRHGLEYGIRPEVAYAQAAKETAFGRFGGTVTAHMHNFCGLKVAAPKADAREDHAAFPDDDTGVRAHYQHLAAYVGLAPIGDVVDPRYGLVKSLPWAGTVRAVEDLGGKWAPNPDYGASIVRDYLTPMLQTQAPPAWDPAAEIRRLREKGLLKEDRDPAATVTWGELATVLNRLSSQA